MAEDSHTPPLSRRIPGATRAGPGSAGRPVLPGELLKVMQAAVNAARANTAKEPSAAAGAESAAAEAGPNGLAEPKYVGWAEHAESATEPLPTVNGAPVSLSQTTLGESGPQAPTDSRRTSQRRSKPEPRQPCPRQRSAGSQPTAATGRC